jgi:hypothetical protein
MSSMAQTSFLATISTSTYFTLSLSQSNPIWAAYQWCIQESSHCHNMPSGQVVCPTAWPCRCEWVSTFASNIPINLLFFLSFSSNCRWRVQESLHLWKTFCWFKSFK